MFENGMLVRYPCMNGSMALAIILDSCSTDKNRVFVHNPYVDPAGEGFYIDLAELQPSA